MNTVLGQANSKPSRQSTTNSATKKANAPADTAKSVVKPIAKDTTAITDTTKKAEPKRDIETTIEYSAEDSIVIDAQAKTAYLYTNSKMKYGTRNITANTIDMDYKTNVITAKVGQDTTGKKLGVPIFEEGSDKYEAQQIKFNYKTKKGQVKNIVTKQGEGIVHGEVVKKQPDNTMYVEHAMYTTCDLREPHFCIKANRIKFVAGKKIITKAFNLQIDDIPTILAFPFGIFPMTKKRASGIIIPSYTDNAARGFGLLGGGFYWAVNQYVGVRGTVDAYTNGGAVWSFNGDYRSRYSFQGNASFSYTNIFTSRDNPANQGQQQAVWIKWSHNTVSKSSGKLAANVNMGSSGFNSNTQYDPNVRNTGQFQSNVSYSNEIKKTPFNYGINFRQSQDVRSGKMDMTLPEASLNMRQIYPLRDIPFINKAEPIKKFNFRISSTFSNVASNIVNAYNAEYPLGGLGFRATGIPVKSDYQNNEAQFRIDSLKKASGIDTIKTSDGNFFDKYKNSTRWTATNSIPIGTTIRFLKFFNLNPNANLRQTIYDRMYEYGGYDASNSITGVKVIRTPQQTYEYSGGASINTRVYGTFYIKALNIEAIRHTMNPSIGYTFVPDFSGQEEIKRVRVKNTGNPLLDSVSMNRYTGAAGTKKVQQQNLSFGLTNQFEMKIRDVKDTAKVSYKKLMLLDNFNLGATYNIVADSFNLSPIAVTARTKIAMFDINFTSSLDPYYYQEQYRDAAGNSFRKRTSFYDWGNNSNNKTAEKSIAKPFGIGQFTTASLAISTSFKPSPKAGPKKIAPVADGTDYYFMAIRNMAPYIDWNVPWSLNISYNMSFQRFTPGPNGTVIDRTIFANNVSLSGDVSLTPKWKINASTAYDINKAQISTTRIMITRDLHCWQASFSYNFMPGFTGGSTDAFIATIGIKASTLKDLKYDRRSQPF